MAAAAGPADLEAAAKLASEQAAGSEDSKPKPEDLATLVEEEKRKQAQAEADRQEAEKNLLSVVKAADKQVGWLASMSGVVERRIMGVSAASAAVDTVLNYVDWHVQVVTNVEPMATKNPTFTFDVIEVPTGTPIDQDTVRQLIRRDQAPTLQQSAVLVRNAALGYGEAGRGSNFMALAGYAVALASDANSGQLYFPTALTRVWLVQANYPAYATDVRRWRNSLYSPGLDHWMAASLSQHPDAKVLFPAPWLDVPQAAFTLRRAVAWVWVMTLAGSVDSAFIGAWQGWSTHVLNRDGSPRRVRPFPFAMPRSTDFQWVAETLHQLGSTLQNTSISHLVFTEFNANPQGGRYLTPMRRTLMDTWENNSQFWDLKQLIDTFEDKQGAKCREWVLEFWGQFHDLLDAAWFNGEDPDWMEVKDLAVQVSNICRPMEGTHPSFDTASLSGQ